MKPKLLGIIVLACTLALAGCVTVSHEELLKQAEAIGYGAPPAPGWEETIKQFMELRLRDAASAQYKFGTPETGWLKKAPVSGGGLDITGYMVKVLINAKNGYGGYAGFETYEFFLRDGKVVGYKATVNGVGFWEKV